MVEFKDLFAQDRQLQYARQAILKYHDNAVPNFIEQDTQNKANGKPYATATGSSAQGPNSMSSRRHIMNIDDISRINYEMIKNSPGNMPATSSTDTDVQSKTENEVNIFKTKMYKNNLYLMNDKFLNSVGDIVGEHSSGKKRGSSAVEAENSDNEEEDDIPLEDQKKWLEEIQKDLIKRYRLILNDEKKWFTLKELLLDANAELDLFSTIDARKPPPNIKLGDMEVPATPYSNISTLLFHDRKKRKLDIQES